MIYREAFAKVLKELREEKNLSQSKLAELSGVSRTYIGQLEKGDRSPTIDIVFMLADALNTSSSKIIAKVEKLIQ